MRKINIPFGGFIRQSLIDYPGFISAVLFIKGCNLRCFYCHNPELVLPDLIRQHPEIDIYKILDFLKENLLLDAVTITGGEPTLYPDLIEFLKLIKDIPLKVKLDTNGTNPDLLKTLIDNSLVDYIAMDIKSPLTLEKYKKITGINFEETMLKKITKSINHIIEGGIDYEFRTTLNHMLNENDIIDIIDSIKGKYFIQYLNIKNKVLNNNITKEIKIDISKILSYAMSKNDVTVYIRN